MGNSDHSPARLRVDYQRGRLHEADMARDPFEQFARWFAEAEAAGVLEANAMVLATVDAEGRPSTRTVLLKGLGGGGFSFFTNLGSRKAADIARCPDVAATFLWLALERQVNIRGRVSGVDRDEAERYFQSRPYRSQLGAHASPQSSVVPNRAWLEERFAAAEQEFPEGAVPLPELWGGYRIVPESIEFWQGRASRLHDRLRYLHEGEGWRIDRLAP